METQELYINDKKARLIGMPLISLITTIAYHKDNFDAINAIVMIGFCISFTNTFLIWEGIRKVFYFFRKKFPNVEQTRERLIYQSIVSVFFTFLITFLIDIICSFLIAKEEW